MSTSAYTEHYIHVIRFLLNLTTLLHTVSTCSDIRPSERRQGVTSFRLMILRSLEWYYSPGFLGMLTGHIQIASPFILCLLATVLFSLITLFSINDDSDIPSRFRITHGHFARHFTNLGCQYLYLSSPLLGLRASRYRGGSAVTPAPGGKVSHLHHQSVVRLMMPARRP